MSYDDTLNKPGEWATDQHKVLILPGMSAKEENITIIHEWLHAFEDVILNIDRCFRETQIEWWAQFHYRQNPSLAPYIRSFYEHNGF